MGKSLGIEADVFCPVLNYLSLTGISGSAIVEMLMYSDSVSPYVSADPLYFSSPGFLPGSCCGGVVRDRLL